VSSISGDQNKLTSNQSCTV